MSDDFREEEDRRQSTRSVEEARLRPKRPPVTRLSRKVLIGLGAVWEGVARGALDAAVRHVSGFVHKDKNKSLADYQAIRQQLGEAKVLVETLRPWRNELAAKLDLLWRAGRPQSEILIPLTEFKVHAAEVANKVAGIGLTVTGGYGYRRGPLERFYRDVRLMRIYEGTSQVQQTIIAKALLREAGLKV